MNLHLTDKFELVDLATLGSRARKYIKPNVLFSDERRGIFEKGDILDANATYLLTKDMLKNIPGGSGGFTHVVITQSEYDNLDSYDQNTIYFIVDSGWKFGNVLPVSLNES